jgi:hypothetical protein
MRKERGGRRRKEEGGGRKEEGGGRREEEGGEKTPLLRILPECISRFFCSNLFSPKVKIRNF